MVVVVVGGGGLLLLLDVVLTHPSDTGRRFIPGWTSSRPEWWAWFTSIQIHLLYFPHKPFPFQAPLLLLWNAALFGTKHRSSLCECVCVCEHGLIPCYPKTSFFVKVDFSRGGERSLFSQFFFPGASDVGRPRPRRIRSNLCLQCRHCWLFALIQFFNYVSSGE